MRSKRPVSSRVPLPGALLPGGLLPGGLLLGGLLLGGLVLGACGGTGADREPPPHAGARLVALHQGKLVDVYGFRTVANSRIIELYQPDMLVGSDIQDERSNQSELADDEVLYDFISANPDTLQPRLLITREIGSDEFQAAVDALDDHLRLISPSQAGRNLNVAPYSVVPRNAALRLTFSEELAITDDFFYDRGPAGEITGYKNTRAVQLLKIVGDPNDSSHFGDFRQIDARITVRGPHIIVDPVLLGTEGLTYGFGNVAGGMPPSPDLVSANIRLAVALDGPGSIAGLSADRNGLLEGRNNDGVPSIIRDFRSGNPSDNTPALSRGFLRDPEPPRLVGHMKMYLERVEPKTEVTREITIFKDGIEHELDRGDLIRLYDNRSGRPIASLEILREPEDDLGRPEVRRVRVLVRPLIGPNGEDVLEDLDPSEKPDFPPVANEARDAYLRQSAPIALLVAEFTHSRPRPGNPKELYGDLPHNFIGFDPTPRADGENPVVPNRFVSPFAGAVVRFSKPIDMDSVIALDSLFFATRDVLGEDSIRGFLEEREKLWGFPLDEGSVGREKFKTPHLLFSNVFDADGSQTAIRAQPRVGFYLDEFMRVAALQDASKPFHEQRYHYFLHLLGGAAGITDLAGNALDFQSVQDPGRPVVDHVVMEFSVDTRYRAGTREPMAPDNIAVYVVRRFADRDEDEKPSLYLSSEVTPRGADTPAAAWRSEDLFGPVSYLPSGELAARPTTRLRRVVDEVNQISPPPQSSVLRWCPLNGPSAFASTVLIVNPTATTPFGLPIQNPLNPFGCRLQTVWREVDVSLSRTDPLDFNLDVEQMYWAPFREEQVYFDEFDRISLFLGHSEHRPEVCIASGSAFPAFPYSGLDGDLRIKQPPPFIENYVDNRSPEGAIERRPPMHPAFTDAVLSINARDAIYEPSRTNRFLPLPKFEDATRGTSLRDPFFVWRNELESAQGGENMEDPVLVKPHPFVLSPFRGGKGDRVVNTPSGIQFDEGAFSSCFDRSLSTGRREFITGGTVGTIALPLMADFWVFPDSAEKPESDPFVATGINGWQISLSVTSAITPFFRSYSAGRESDPVGPTHPFKWNKASGGYDLSNAPTPPRDNSVYWTMIDFLKRTTVATSGFVEILNPHRMPVGPVEDPTHFDPRLGPYPMPGALPDFAYDFEPAASRLPAGTSVVVEFRGASELDAPSPYWPQAGSNPVTATNFPNDPLKAGDAHIRHFDDRIIPGGSTSRQWWTYLYNRTVTEYTEDPNDLADTAFTDRFSGPNESFRAEDVRYVNWRFVMKNNLQVDPPVTPKLQSFALSYRLQRR